MKTLSSVQHKGMQLRLTAAPLMLLLGLVFARAGRAQGTSGEGSTQGKESNIMRVAPPVQFAEGSTAQCQANTDRINSVMDHVFSSTSEGMRLKTREQSIPAGLAMGMLFRYKTYCTEGRIEPDLAKCSTFRAVVYRLYDAGCESLTRKETRSRGLLVTVKRKKNICEYGRGVLMSTLADAC